MLKKKGIRFSEKVCPMYKLINFPLRGKGQNYEVMLIQHHYTLEAVLDKNLIFSKC